MEVDAPSPAAATNSANSAPSAQEAESLVVEDIKQHFLLLEKSAATYDPRFVLKVFRDLGSLRKRLTPSVLQTVIAATYASGDATAAILGEYVGGVAESSTDTSEAGPEIDLYLYLLVLVYLLDSHATEQSVAFSEAVITKLASVRSRALDYIAAKLWFYVARAAELAGKLPDIRPKMLSALRTATLQYDTETQASLITLLLRSYLLTQNYPQAANLISKTTFPENAANALVARYYYYLAKVHAIQLHYSDAHDCAISAIRKAPQTPLSAGFVQAAHKLNIVVELLMGDIPELSVFRQPLLEKALVPYRAVAQAVRVGDLQLFAKTVAQYTPELKRDGNLSLVARLRQNVIKTGIRTISLTYSRISLRDICIKLHLGSEETAEYVVSRAIRDGVIDAAINHEKGYMESKELLDVYATDEPQKTFDARIQFCIALHNDSVKAMRYPVSTSRVDNKADEEMRERETDLISELLEGDFDGDDYL